MKHNSSVNFKLIHFILWIKESHQSPNFEAFECSGENLPQSSCLFLSHKAVFLQILHHYSVSWKTTPLYLKHYIFWSKGAHQTANVWDFWVLPSKFVKLLLSILKRQVNCSSNFASFFIVMTYNSFVNFKVIHVLLWKKESYQSPNFETFECSGETLPNCSCHFSNHKSVFL